ncbi:MAG TPA: hypothetical protein VFG68_07265 [Fimbriiglobus sp.]|nr:hypothetical protein [Fimbriiglobus sp.]
MSTLPRQKPEATGMNSTLKYTILPLVLVVVVVFGITLISLGVGDQTTTEPTGVMYSPPLYFTLTEMAYDPSSDQVAKRTFPGFYEPTGGKQFPVSYWFNNPHPVPVRVAILSRSCTQCSSARLAIVSSDAIRSAAAARAAVAGGLVVPDSPNGLTAQETDALSTRLTWQNFDLEHPDQSIEVPPGSADNPTWGILQFGVQLAVVGPKPLSVNVGLTAGDNPQAQMPFHMVLVGVNPFEVAPKAMSFGDLRQGAGPVTKELIYWSASRGPTTDPPLRKPAITAGPDSFLKVGEPVELPPAQVEPLAVQLSVEGKGGPIRVRGAYRVPVTVYRHLPDQKPAEPDIGPFERQVGVSMDGTLHTVAVPVTANVLGLVELVDSQVADLRHFNGRAGVEKAFNLASDRADLVLRPLPDEFKPKVLQATLSEPQSAGGARRQWTLKVSLGAGAWVGSLPADSVVVLEAKTTDGVRKVRIPVKGVAFSGAR